MAKSKEQKQSEAQDRQALADSRTPAEKFRRLEDGGFVAKKERTKLAKELRLAMKLK